LLVLDEKQIRKGKPIGLPYVGSKKKVSKKIVEIIKQNFEGDEVYDVFGGGGAITAELLLNGFKVHYNDLDETITDMFEKVISSDREWIKTLLISRKEFFEIREHQNKTTDDELKLLLNSFGNNRRSYLYSIENSDLKYTLAKDILNKHDTFSGYKQTVTYKDACKQLQDLEQLQRLEQLQQLQQLERLQQLEQLGRLKHSECLTISNFDYRHFSNVKNSIIYLDPPYENTDTTTYRTGDFDYQEFYNWAVELAENNVVLLSGYEVTDERFEPVYEFTTERSTISANGKGNNKTEKLFMIKKGAFGNE